MSSRAKRLPEEGTPATLLGLERLWLALAERDWAVVVLVPADPGESTAGLAAALAAAGTRLSHEPVSSLVIDPDQDPKVLADVQDLVRRERQRARAPLWDLARAGGEGRAPSPVGAPEPRGKTVISIPPVTRELLGVAIARAADAVVVAVRMRRSRLADARRTIEAIGHERIAGCFLVE